MVSSYIMRPCHFLSESVYDKFVLASAVHVSVTHLLTYTIILLLFMDDVRIVALGLLEPRDQGAKGPRS